jgi:hypothetical protein
MVQKRYPINEWPGVVINGVLQPGVLTASRAKDFLIK